MGERIKGVRVKLKKYHLLLINLLLAIFIPVFRSVAQSGSALRSGRRSRRFKSSHSDIKKGTYESVFLFTFMNDKKNISCNYHVRAFN